MPEVSDSAQCPETGHDSDVDNLAGTLEGLELSDVSKAAVDEAAHAASHPQGEDAKCYTHEPTCATTGEDPAPLLASFDLQGIADYILASDGKLKIVCMIGAGLSVSAGIPDFRSPKTGLYANLQKYKLPHPSAVFELDYFRKNPDPFYLLAKELMPGKHKPTPAHHFIKLLHDKGLLLRCYTQNIDSLEMAAGMPAESVIAAHGNFDSASCIDCAAAAELDAVIASIDAGKVMKCAKCDGLVKPDIVFFGESLPFRFFNQAEEDTAACELLMIMGTSLVVYPFAALKDMVTDSCPRLLINRESDVGNLDFGEGNLRDALFEGDCDDGVWKLAQLLGWSAELDKLVEGAAKRSCKESDHVNEV